MLSPTDESAAKIRALIAAYRREDDDAANILLNDLVETNEDATLLLQTLASHNAVPVRHFIDLHGVIPALATRSGKEVRIEDPQAVAFLLTMFEAERRTADAFALSLYATTEPRLDRGDPAAEQHEFFYAVLNVLLQMALDHNWLRVAMPVESGQN